jgi:hypothetical protein
MRISIVRILAASAPFIFVLICNSLLAARKLAAIGCFGCLNYDEEIFSKCTGSIHWYLQHFNTLTPMMAQKKVFDEGAFKCPDPDTHRLFVNCYSAVRHKLERGRGNIGFKRAQQLVYGEGSFVCPDPDWDLTKYPDCSKCVLRLLQEDPTLSLQRAQALAAMQEPAQCAPPVDSAAPVTQYPDCAGSIKWMIEHQKYEISSVVAQAKVFLEGTGKCPWPEHLPRAAENAEHLRGKGIPP